MRGCQDCNHMSMTWMPFIYLLSICRYKHIHTYAILKHCSSLLINPFLGLRHELNKPLKSFSCACSRACLYMCVSSVYVHVHGYFCLRRPACASTCKYRRVCGWMCLWMCTNGFPLKRVGVEKRTLLTTTRKWANPSSAWNLYLWLTWTDSCNSFF